MNNNQNDKVSGNNPLGALLLIFLALSIGFFIWATFFSISPEEKAKIQAMEEETARIEKQNQIKEKELLDQQQRLENAKAMVSSVVSVDDMENDYQKGDYLGALECADIILSGNPDTITIAQIADLCKRIGDTKPKGEIARKLYIVSDKGDKILESRQKK